MAIQSNPPADLRGSPIGLEGIGSALNNLISSIRQDPNDPMRHEIMTNINVGKQIAAQGFNRIQQVIAAGGEPGKEDLGLSKMVPDVLVREAMKNYPEMEREVVTRRAAATQVTPEESATVKTRPERTALAYEGEITPQEEASAAAAGVRAEGAKSKVTEQESNIQFDTNKYAVEHGWDANARGALQTAQARVAGLQTQLTESAVSNFKNLWDSASPFEQRILMTGLMGSQGALYGQYLLGQAQFNWQASLSSIKDAKTQFETDLAQFEAVTAVRKERDRLIDETRKLLEDKPKGWEGQLDILRNDINDTSTRLLRLDPSAFVATANKLKGFFGGTKGVDFSVGDLLTAANGGDPTKTAADQIEYAAILYNELGGGGAAQGYLQETLKDPLTGRINDVLWSAIMQRASDLKTGKDTPDQQRRQAATLAKGYLNGTGDPSEIDKRIERLQLQLNAALAKHEAEGGATPQKIPELQTQIRLWSMVATFVNPILGLGQAISQAGIGEGGGSMSIPRPPGGNQ